MFIYKRIILIFFFVSSLTFVKCEHIKIFQINAELRISLGSMDVLPYPSLVRFKLTSHK